MNEIKDSKKCLQRWLERIQEKRPLLECLTNVVTINDVANVILACGASPVMADAADEVPDFVNIASGVVINVGTMQNRGSYEIAMRYAQEYGKPVVLDPVGVGAAKARTPPNAPNAPAPHMNDLREIGLPRFFICTLYI